MYHRITVSVVGAGLTEPFIHSRTLRGVSVNCGVDSVASGGEVQSDLVGASAVSHEWRSIDTNVEG